MKSLSRRKSLFKLNPKRIALNGIIVSSVTGLLVLDGELVLFLEVLIWLIRPSCSAFGGG